MESQAIGRVGSISHPPPTSYAEVLAVMEQLFPLTLASIRFGGSIDENTKNEKN